MENKTNFAEKVKIAAGGIFMLARIKKGAVHRASYLCCDRGSRQRVLGTSKNQ